MINKIRTPLFVSTAPSRLCKRAIGQQWNQVTLNSTVYERTREKARERTDRDGQRDGQTEIWTNRDRRTSLAPKNSLVLNSETLQCLAGRGSVRRGGMWELIGRRLSSEYDRCIVQQPGT